MLRGEGVYVKIEGGICLREGDMLRGGGVRIVISLISNRGPH